MKHLRLFLPLLCACSLLFAQQAGAAHTVNHLLEQARNQDKQSQPSPACEKCAAYAQLGSALNVAAIDFVPPAATDEIIHFVATGFHSHHTLAAVARGPPVSPNIV
jgi:hypothetical protein